MGTPLIQQSSFFLVDVFCSSKEDCILLFLMFVKAVVKFLVFQISFYPFHAEYIAHLCDTAFNVLNEWIMSTSKRETKLNARFQTEADQSSWPIQGWAVHLSFLGWFSVMLKCRFTKAGPLQTGLELSLLHLRKRYQQISHCALQISQF